MEQVRLLLSEASPSVLFTEVMMAVNSPGVLVAPLSRPCPLLTWAFDCRALGVVFVPLELSGEGSC